jgi:hypothetical protein
MIRGDDMGHGWKRAAALVAALLGTAAPAAADTITWRMKSFHPNAVHVKFYSMNRNHEWPTRTTAYAIRDYKQNNMKISCVNGERICYGAYVVGNVNSYWGVGNNPKRSCTSCCYVCRGNVTTTVFNLNQSR